MSGSSPKMKEGKIKINVIKGSGGNKPPTPIRRTIKVKVAKGK